MHAKMHDTTKVAKLTLPQSTHNMPEYKSIVRRSVAHHHQNLPPATKVMICTRGKCNETLNCRGNRCKIV